MFHRFSAGEAATRPAFRKVLNLKAGQYAAIVVHPDDSTWVKVFTHYDAAEEARVICRGDSCRCGGSGEAWSRDMRVFCPIQYIIPILCGESAMMPANTVPTYGLFAFTENCLHVLGECRSGGCWFVRRRGRKKNGPLEASSLLWSFVPRRWPDDLTVMPTLQRIYGVPG